MQYPIGKSVLNTSTGIQNKIFIEMTPLVYQIHGHLITCYKACT